MKKFYIILLVLICKSVTAQTISDLFSVNKTVPLTWLGIDYSHVKLVGEFSQLSATDPITPVTIRDKYFPAWNNLVLAEPEKFDIKGMMKYTDITNDIDMVTKLNFATPEDSLVAKAQVVYTKSDIARFVSAYDLSGKTGFGIVFIAENMDKTTVAATFHVVIINLVTKEILLTERVRTEPAGFGVRNYWAGSIYKTIDMVNKVYYKKWKSTYGVK